MEKTMNMKRTLSTNFEAQENEYTCNRLLRILGAQSAKVEEGKTVGKPFFL